MISKNKWNTFALHCWLLMSSYGIIFASISFVEDLGFFKEIKMNYPWIKGITSIILGILFYFIIGLPHLDGAKNR